MNLGSFIRLCNRYNEEALKITCKYVGYDSKNDLHNVRAVFGGFLNGDEFVITLKTNIKNGIYNYSQRLGGLCFSGCETSFRMHEVERFLMEGLDRLQHYISANSTGGGAYIEVTGDL